MIRRRFVNVVAENYKTGVYSLHRLDIYKHLFHQSRADARVMPFLAEEAQGKSYCPPGGDELERLKELPAPCVKIHPSFRDERVFDKMPLCGLLSPRSSEDKFLCINCYGDTMLCYGDRPSVDPMPHLGDQVQVRPISFSLVRRPDAQDQEEEEDLYVIHNVPDMYANTSCFRVLRKDADADGGWRWESLPPPPLAGAPSYDPYIFTSHTVVDGGRTICFSCAKPGIIGTYCFDTAEREWRRAGDWILPFVGRGEYVPDLALWLGFSPDSPSYDLCGTSDLNAIAMSSVEHPHAPKLQYVWQDLVTPENWSAGRAELVSLGSGRFCIAKDFVIESRRTGESSGEEEWWELEDEVTVLTGIEVGRDDAERLKVWKHKSMQYSSMSMYRVMGVL